MTTIGLVCFLMALYGVSVRDRKSVPRPALIIMMVLVPCLLIGALLQQNRDERSDDGLRIAAATNTVAILSFQQNGATATVRRSSCAAQYNVNRRVNAASPLVAGTGIALTPGSCPPDAAQLDDVFDAQPAE